MMALLGAGEGAALEPQEVPRSRVRGVGVEQSGGSGCREAGAHA